MATKQNSTSILGDINPPKAIIKLALPATLALLAKAVYNIGGHCLHRDAGF